MNGSRGARVALVLLLGIELAGCRAWSGPGDREEEVTEASKGLCANNNPVSRSSSASAVICYVDADGDGFGAGRGKSYVCACPSGYADVAGDCADNDDTVFPRECHQDSDGDGLGSIEGVTVCGSACELGMTEDSTDCDDTDPEVYEYGSCFEDRDSDGYVLDYRVCRGRTCRQGDVDPFGPSDCNDGDDRLHDILTCYGDQDRDGYASSYQVCGDLSSDSPCPVGYSDNPTSQMDDDDTVPRTSSGPTISSTPKVLEIAPGTTERLLVTVASTSDMSDYREAWLEGLPTGVSYVARGLPPRVVTVTSYGIFTTFFYVSHEFFITASSKQAVNRVGIAVAIPAAGGEQIYVRGLTLTIGDTDGWTEAEGDCDPLDADVHPGAIDVCGDKVDNDCNGVLDDGWLQYVDADVDGFGDPDSKVRSCATLPGYVDNGRDCDDSRASANPVATEFLGNGLDDNCNGRTDESWVSFAGGLSHSLAVHHDGIVWAWGENDAGQLGVDTHGEDAPSPVRVESIDAVVAVAAGQRHSAALLRDGTVLTWGNDVEGNSDKAPHPIRLGCATSSCPVLSGIKDIAAGAGHLLMLAKDGIVYSYGDNYYGALGCGSGCTTSGVQKVVRLTGVTDIAAGDGTSFAVRSDGRLFAWGSNRFHSLGVETWDDELSTSAEYCYQAYSTTSPAEDCWNAPMEVPFMCTASCDNWNLEKDRAYPAAVVGIDDAVAIAAGYSHTVALRADQTAMTWGTNEQGELGIGLQPGTYATVPQTVPLLSGLTDIAAGQYLTLALMSDGTVWGWGSNEHGQLGPVVPSGHSGASLHTTPVQHTGVPKIEAFVAGMTWVLGVDSRGAGWAWGSNLCGELGNGELDIEINDTATLVE